MSTLINFYILAEVKNIKSLMFACSRIEHAFLNKESVYVKANDAREAAMLDKLVWTFKDTSFIPHEIFQGQPNANVSVYIGTDDPENMTQKVLINLKQDFTTAYQSYERVEEIVFADAELQANARDRYKNYRAAGYDITTHKIKASELDEYHRQSVSTQRH